LAGLLRLDGFEIPADWFAHCCNLTADMLRELSLRSGAVILGKSRKIIASQQRLMTLQGEILAILGAYHREHNDQAGVTMKELRTLLSPMPSGDCLAYVVGLLGQERQVESAGPYIHLTAHSAQYNAAELAIWRGVLERFEDGPPCGFTLDEVARDLHHSDAAMRAVLLRRCRNGDLWQINARNFMLGSHVVVLVGIAAELAASDACGFTAAQFRDASGLGRNFTIKLLEFFDAIGVTHRRVDLRVMREAYAAVIGR
ncbi:MAG: hypothetical protein RLY97_1590, partial [Pseudomonadota bacterium]